MLLASILTAIVLTTLLAEIGPVHTIMSHPALRWLGERSFSLYLWHWPIVMLIKQLFMNNRMAVSQWTIGAIAFALSIPIAHYSYMWIETPIRRRGYRAVLGNIWGGSAWWGRGIVALAVAGIMISTTIAVATSPTKTSLEQQLTAIAEEQTPKHHEITAIPAAENTDVMAPTFGPPLVTLSCWAAFPRWNNDSPGSMLTPKYPVLSLKASKLFGSSKMRAGSTHS